MAEQIQGTHVDDLLTLMTLPPYAWLRWADTPVSDVRWHPACMMKEIDGEQGGFPTLLHLIQRDGLVVESHVNHLTCSYTACLLR